MVCYFVLDMLETASGARRPRVLKENAEGLNYLRYARTRPIRSSASSAEGIALFSWPDGATALLDAVYLGLSVMRNARNDRKVLLIVSDGGDNHSRYTARDVMSALAESNVQICAMGVLMKLPEPGPIAWGQTCWLP